MGIGKLVNEYVMRISLPAVARPYTYPPETVVGPSWKITYMPKQFP